MQCKLHFFLSSTFDFAASAAAHVHRGDENESAVLMAISKDTAGFASIGGS